MLLTSLSEIAEGGAISLLIIEKLLFLFANPLQFFARLQLDLLSDWNTCLMSDTVQ